MKTKAERLARRRELYALRYADKVNADRRKKYAVGKESGLSYKEARDIRGYESNRITKKYPKIRYKTDSNTYYMYKVKVKAKKIEEVLTKSQLNNIRKKDQYKRARLLGYSPKEAQYLRNVAEEKFINLTEQSTPLYLANREKRWFRMNSKSDYDDYIEEAVKAINIDKGYDPASRYGWAVYYFWYLFGGDIENWKAYVDADAFNPDALGYIEKLLPAF